MKTFVLAATLSLLAAPAAFAQSDLDRLATATEAASANLEAFFVSRVPSLAEAMPDWTFDEEMRDAGACTLDAVREREGDDAVEQYLTSLEAFAVLEITSMQQMALETPVPIDADTGMAIAQACGSDEIAMRRMQESGFMEAMMDPNTMMALMN
jgi:hypothetical protein